LIRNVDECTCAMSYLPAVGSGCMSRPHRVP